MSDFKAIDPSDLVFSEKTETFSKWKNNNDKKAMFRLLTHEKKTGTHRDFGADCKGSLFLRVEIEPGQTIQLNSEYDQAIRQLDDKTGQIVGGLCPWLTKLGEEEVVVHTSLDYKAAFELEEAAQAVEALKKENELRAALAQIEKYKENIKAKKKA